MIKNLDLSLKDSKYILLNEIGLLMITKKYVKKSPICFSDIKRTMIDFYNFVLETEDIDLPFDEIKIKFSEQDKNSDLIITMEYENVALQN